MDLGHGGLGSIGLSSSYVGLGHGIGLGGYGGGLGGHGLGLGLSKGIVLGKGW